MEPNQQPTPSVSNDPIEVKLPSGSHTAKLRPFPNARLRRDTRSVFLKYAKIDPKKAMGKSQEQIKAMNEGEITKLEDVPAVVVNDINDAVLNNMVIELDGDKEGILERAYDLQDTDFDFLLAECRKISNETAVSGNDAKKK